MLEQQEGYANGTHPTYRASQQRAASAVEQMRAKSGPAYERWVAGVRRHAESLSTTEGETSDTFPA